jgi:hypothetical protein
MIPKGCNPESVFEWWCRGCNAYRHTQREDRKGKCSICGTETVIDGSES